MVIADVIASFMKRHEVAIFLMLNVFAVYWIGIGALVYVITRDAHNAATLGLCIGGAGMLLVAYLRFMPEGW